jgi:hypothetical protein
MQSLSKKNIIHFTGCIQNIESILKDKGFRMKYCQEEFSFANSTISAAVHPMVCFSSHSQRELKSLEITYGRYGIALSKDWALRKGIHEVLYLEKNSIPAKALAALWQARQGKNGDLPVNLRQPVIQIKCFVKNATGKNKKAGMNEFDFRAENEWRYVPTKKQIGGEMISQHKSVYQRNKTTMNKTISKYMVSFTTADVVQVYVDKLSEINQLVDNTGLDEKLFSVSPWKYLRFIK